MIFLSINFSLFFQTSGFVCILCQIFKYTCISQYSRLLYQFSVDSVIYWGLFGRQGFLSDACDITWPMPDNNQYGLSRLATVNHLVWRARSSGCCAKFPTNTRHQPNVWPMLAHRLRRWSNIGQTFGQCLVFAGLASIHWSQP